MPRPVLLLAAMLCLLGSEASARTGFSLVLSGTAEIPPILTGASGSCDNVWAIPAQERDWLTSGLFYVNIHSAFAPGGELRGQILADPTPIRRPSFARLKALFH